MTPSGPNSSDNDQDPLAPDPTEGGDPSLVEQPRDPGLGEGEETRDLQGKGEGPLARLTGLGSDMGQRVAALGARLDNLSAGLAAHGDQIRDAERSLVDRIGDVDDDRRRTQSQLQRAMQSRYDEVDTRLSRLGGRMTLGLLLVAVLAGAGLYLLHQLHQQRLEELQGDLMAEVQTLGLEVGRLKGTTATDDTGVQEQLAALSAALEEVSADLTKPPAVSGTESAAVSPEAASLTERITRLESGQQWLIAEIDKLRQTLATTTTAPPPSMDAAVTGAVTHPAGPAMTPAPAEAPDESADHAAATEGTASDTEAPAPAQSAPEPASAPPGPPSTAKRPYALQLMGSYDRDAVLAVAARSDLPESVFIREERLRGRPWFVLIHSLHPSYAEAQAAHARLPADLARLDTWIRKLPPEANLEPIRTGHNP